ncbi:MAG: helical backbone metal receptor [Cytophagaceae bacterium]
MKELSWMKFTYIVLFLVSGFWSCTNNLKKNEDNTSIYWVDDLGREVEIRQNPQRIIGLAPSMTELLFAICDRSKIIARTQNCNYPDAVESLPVVNNYPLDLENLLMSSPDVVFAVDGINNPNEIEAIEKLNIPVVVFKFKTVTDILEGIRAVGEITNHTLEADHLADSLQSELNKIKNTYRDKKNVRVLALIWTDPIYAHGYYSFMTDKLKYINAHNVVDTLLKKESPELSVEYVLKVDPDIIIGTTPEKVFGVWPQLKMLKCYNERAVVDLTDDLQSRSGPRVVEAIRELASAIYEK